VLHISSFPPTKNTEQINNIERHKPYWKNPRPHVRGEHGEEFAVPAERWIFSGLVPTAV
jgi:hypothetical protein